jgi:hypothetical protein
MAVFLTRFFALLTLFSYLAVGTVLVRVFAPEQSEISLSLNYFSMLKTSQLPTQELVAIETPKQEFQTIAMDVAQVVRRLKSAKISKFNQPKDVPYSLPFGEPVRLSKLEMSTHLVYDLMGLYRPAPAIEKQSIIAEVHKEIIDEVKTQMASAIDVDKEEPTFLDYSDKSQPLAEAVEDQNSNTVEKKIETAAITTPKESSETVEVDDLLTFDYSTAQKNIEQGKETVVSQVGPASNGSINLNPSTQNILEPTPKTQKTQKHSAKPLMKEEVQGLIAKDPGYLTEMNIQAVGSNLIENENLNNFEVRFQDTLSESTEDYGSGIISIKEKLAQDSMTRSVVVLKKGFVPTNTDLIIEAGFSEVSIPLIEQEKLNELNAPYERNGSVGSVLIELDDDTIEEGLDTQFGEAVSLDGNLKKTTSDDYRYKLYLGVRSGNTLVTYKNSKGVKVSKIIHVHENELTYDANHVEEIKNDEISLYEEDILAKEKSPLVISAEQVKKFASTMSATKISDHKYRTNYESNALGSRRYVELTHQEEPIFAGIKNVQRVVIPSENFMRFVLSRFEDARLGNRCLVQVNISKPISSVEVAAESSGSSLMTHTQMLDADGKFYDSASEKTKKVIIMGDNQIEAGSNPDSKINIKVDYQDGTVEYLGTFCSPNTYLVEQL